MTITQNIRVSETFAAVSANRIEHSLSCQGEHLLYSRSHCPILYNLRTKQITSYLIGHKAEINGQRFVITDEINKHIKHIVSTSYDKTAKIWEISDKENFIGHKLLFTLECPESKHEFMSVCTIRSCNQHFLTIATTVLGSIYFWRNENLLQTIKTTHCYFDIKYYKATIQDMRYQFIFLAGGDNMIHIYRLLEDSLEHLFDLTGHSDWVKALSIIDLPGREGEFLLASASQDAFVRVWHMKLVDYAIDASQIRTQVSQPLNLEPNHDKGIRLTATLETVLTGHEGIIHGLCWFKKQEPPKLKLVTCSADKTIIIWSSSVAASNSLEVSDQRLNKYEQCPASSEVWSITDRIGETGETNLPFLSVCLSHNEDIIYANSLRGSIHSWKYEGGGTPDIKWAPSETILGHFEPVSDLSWEKSGTYLLSSSLDKTCRLYAIASNDNKWHELARPQVHGHEINCLTSLGFTKFATGAEEKTIRTFGATQFFIKNFKALALEGKNEHPGIDETTVADLPVHAQLPALGLSNRGAQSPYDVEESGDKAEVGSSSNAWFGVSKLVMQLANMEHLNELPFEEILLQSTLWWETSKLFGHSNELHALAADSTGAFLASASKANRPDLANIIVWECSKFRKVANIEHHSLTITRLKFSPDDKYLLSVSRDRTWCLSQKTGQLRSAYQKLIGTNKSNSIHDRIIWDCCWTSDSKQFLTVSRDKKAILWSLDAISQISLGDTDQPQQVTPCISTRLFEHSIQAVDCLDRIVSSSHVIAFGLEDGSLELHGISVDNPTNWSRLTSISHFHHLPIRRLAFRPSNKSEILLASAGDDCIVKLTSIDLNN